MKKSFKKLTLKAQASCRTVRLVRPAPTQPAAPPRRFIYYLFIIYLYIFLFIYYLFTHSQQHLQGEPRSGVQVLKCPPQLGRLELISILTNIFHIPDNREILYSDVLGQGLTISQVFTEIDQSHTKIGKTPRNNIACQFIAIF